MWQQINRTLHMLGTLPARLNLVLARGHDKKHRSVPDEHAINPNLRTRWHGPQHEFPRIAASLLFERLAIDHFRRRARSRRQMGECILVFGTVGGCEAKVF